MVLSVRNLPPVADNVHSSDNLADSEETKNLSGGDTGKCDLLGVGTADAVQDVLRREGAGRGVAGGVKEVLEVGLEGSQVAVGTSKLAGGLWFRSVDFIDGILTEGSCSGHGKPVCRAQVRLSSSRR